MRVGVRLSLARRFHVSLRGVVLRAQVLCDFAGDQIWRCGARSFFRTDAACCVSCCYRHSGLVSPPPAPPRLRGGEVVMWVCVRWYLARRFYAILREIIFGPQVPCLPSV